MADVATIFAVLPFLASALLLHGALHDVVARTIPNALVGAIALVGAALRFHGGELPLAILAASGTFAAAAFAFTRGLLGGGDVKLLGSVALLVPPGRVPSLLLTIALAGGALSVVYLGLSLCAPVRTMTRSPSIVTRIARIELWRIRRRRSVPYITAIAAGTALTMFGTRA